MATPRLMLIGAGSMGTHHARVAATSTRASLAVVVDRDENAARTLADRCGVAWAAEPDFSGVDAVIVAATTEVHRQVADAVLAAGLPLLLEKPLAPDIDAARAIVTASQAHGTPLMCGYVERFNPAVLTARAFVTEPTYVTAQRHSPYSPRIKTGVAWDLLVHDVDLAIQLLGSAPTTVQSALRTFSPLSLPDAEDVADVILGFESGAIANVSAARIGHRKVRTMVIHEQDRLIELDLLRRGVTIYRHVSEQLSDNGRGYRQQTIIEIPDLITSQEPLAAQLDRFIDLITGVADADAERRSLLPAHQVIAQVKA